MQKMEALSLRHVRKYFTPWQGFSVSTPLTFGEGSFFVLGAVQGIAGCLTTSLALHPLNARNIPLHPTLTQTRNVSKRCRMFPGEQNLPWLRTTALWFLTSTLSLVYFFLVVFFFQGPTVFLSCPPWFHFSHLSLQCMGNILWHTE